MKIVNIELLVRAIELLEAYQVGSISPEKLDVNTNKLSDNEISVNEISVKSNL